MRLVPSPARGGEDDQHLGVFADQHPVSGAPLAGRVHDREAVGKTRRHLAGKKVAPGRVADEFPIRLATAEEQAVFGESFGALRAGRFMGLHGRLSNGGECRQSRSGIQG